MFAPQPQPEFPCEYPCSVTEPRGVTRLALVGRRVKYRAGQLAVMRPRSAIQVVRADHGPDVVDDHDLGVHIHGRARVVFDVVDRESVTAGRSAHLDRLLTSHQTRPARCALLVRVARDDGDHVQVGIAAQRRGQQLRDERRPEVLVLDVDQPASTSKGLSVGVGDAAFAERSERVPAQAGWIRPQHLHRVRARRLRLGCRLGQVAADELAGVICPVDQHPYRAGQIQDSAAVPPFAEGVFEVGDSRPPHRGLHVVPRWVLAVATGEIHGLPVAGVPCVVVARAAEIDPAEEGDVEMGTTGVAHDRELLVVRTGPPGTRIQQHLTARVGQLPRQLRVLALALVEPARLRAPDQAEDEYALLGDLGENVADRRPRSGKKFVDVAPEVGEIDLVVRLRAAQHVMEAGEVVRAVDKWLDQIARRPATDVRCRVATLGVAEEPGADTGIVLARHGGQCGLIAAARPGYEGSGHA